MNVFDILLYTPTKSQKHTIHLYKTILYTLRYTLSFPNLPFKKIGLHNALNEHFKQKFHILCIFSFIIKIYLACVHFAVIYEPKAYNKICH